jgi:hypothetical protein
MAIGAQGYSIGDAIRTLTGQVLEVMYFKKWQTGGHKKAPGATPGLFHAATMS